MDNKPRPIPNSEGLTAADNQRRELQSVVQSHKDSSSDDGTPVWGDVQTCTDQCLEITQIEGRLRHDKDSSSKLLR